MTEDTLFLPGLSPVESLDIHARFDGGALSSDGGVLILREIERKLGFAAMLAGCMHDRRDPVRIRHALEENRLQDHNENCWTRYFFAEIVIFSEPSP